jgi:hypothetical protein
MEGSNQVGSDALGNLSSVTASLEALINSFTLVGSGLSGDIQNGFHYDPQTSGTPDDPSDNP